MSQLAQGLSALSVRRPVLIIMVNLLIVLCGVASLLGLDIRELPNVDRPVVGVRAVYTGASPGTMDNEVTRVLENAVARVPGVENIASSSEENNMRIRIEFSSDIDINTAANDIREAVSRAQRELPEAIDQVTVIKADDNAQAIVELAAYSDTLTRLALAERIEKDIAPELQSIDGVAEVRIEGIQRRVLKIAIKPSQLASHGLAISDVLETFRGLAIDVPVGSFKSLNQDLVVRAQAAVVQPEQIKQTYLRDNLRIGDVADVYFAPDDAESYSLLNGRGVIGLSIVRQAGANTIAIAEAVDQRMADINARFSELRLVKTSDDSIYIRGALSEVFETLLISILIVLAVIAVFIGQWRSVLIPVITIPIALIGTLAVIWLCGFSVNLLTLLALVLATGLIVDDAIIVLENMQRQSDQGIAKLAAAVIGTRQVFFAVIATTITLVAVFVPIAFLPGETGRLFREFGLVLATAVVISSFVAVTLCPMLYSRLPASSQENRWLAGLRAPLEAIGKRLAARYLLALETVLQHRAIGLAIALLIAAAGVIGFYQLNQELLPAEDRGSIRVSLMGPDGASLAYSDAQSQEVEKLLTPYKANGLVTDIYTIVGLWDKNRAYTVATLAPWRDRHISQQAISAQLNPALSAIPGAQVRLIQGNSLNIRGGGEGLKIALLGNDYTALHDAAIKFADVLKSRVPVIERVRIQFDTSQPELSFSIDRDKANDLNVSITRLTDTLRVMVDSLELLDISMDDQAVPLQISAAQGHIGQPMDLLNLSVPSETGELIPLSALVTVSERGVAAELDRHAQRRAIEMDLDIPPGSSLSDAADAVRAMANETLTPATSLIFLGEAATLQASSYDTLLTFILALLVVFLVLAAQFESIGSAFIVMFTVPFGLAAAIFALLLSGQSLNLYSQIGLVMLVGLMTKNAILLIEFMDQLRDQGYDIAEAIHEAVQLRLRPVIMTVLSTVLGALPLVLSDGPGAEARNAIGWVIVGGLGLSTLMTLFLAPLGYALLAPWTKPRSHQTDVLLAQLAQAKQPANPDEKA